MNRRNLYIPGGIIAAIVVAGLLIARGPAAESASTVLRPVGALITLVAGHVDVIRGEKPEEGPVPLFARSYVYPGDRIVTGSDGRAELTMTKSARTVRVERASVLALEGRVEGEKIVIAGARVDTGAVWVKVSAGQEPFELGLGSVDARVSEGVVAVSSRARRFWDRMDRSCGQVRGLISPPPGLWARSSQIRNTSLKVGGGLLLPPRERRWRWSTAWLRRRSPGG